MLEQKIRNFFWNRSNNEDEIPLIAWEKIYRPKDKGGAGIRNWQIMNQALRAKLIWAMYENTHLYWVRILKGKYLDSGENHMILTMRDPLIGSAI